MNDVLDRLAAKIRHLHAALVEDERAAFDLCHLGAIERAAMTRAQLDVAFVDYFTTAEDQRARFCPIHGANAPTYLACPDCVRAAQKRGGPAIPTPDPRFKTP